MQSVLVGHATELLQISRIVCSSITLLRSQRCGFRTVRSQSCNTNVVTARAHVTYKGLS